ncbi:type IX secretion system membrane protein PorP/SprF [Carboxylicivirga sediminis]|uniref:Type IX secretion system membrane protein PorP/SprF n=1 Tax=Carboxylicivirga sediminis TaxID=2006564 RepID=A0A941F3A1_9BACT|nr:type IX secretion system membrane protein PorP/SprF [Carboxylicivirga sediminis]MBR8534985.1 type IX secretion system membrane protein PorP/SprF [Carboxylicivirga sediminis]
MARRIVFFLLFCIASLAWGQQYPQFSQNMFNHLTVNPGYAGTSEMMNLTLGNRQQWMGGFKGADGSSLAPSTTVFGVDTEVNLLGWNSGVGLTIMNDEIGAFTTLYMSAVYAKRWETDYGKLGVGLSLGLLNQGINGSILKTMPEFGYGQDITGDNSHVDEQFPDDQGTAFDAGFGAFLEHKTYYLGISVAHLNQPKPKFKDTYTTYLDRTVFITGGYRIQMKKRPIILVPSIFLKTNMSSYQIDWNINGILKDKYWGGLTYRMQDAIVLLGGVELNNGLRIGYSYDISISELSEAKNGSHEIMLGYRFDLSIEKRKKQYKSVRYL